MLPSNHSGAKSVKTKLLRLLVMVLALAAGEVFGAFCFLGTLQTYNGRLTFQPESLQDYLNLLYLGLDVIVIPVCFARLGARLFDWCLEK